MTIVRWAVCCVRTYHYYYYDKNYSSVSPRLGSLGPEGEEEDSRQARGRSVLFYYYTVVSSATGITQSTSKTRVHIYLLLSVAISRKLCFSEIRRSNISRRFHDSIHSASHSNNHDARTQHFMVKKISYLE